jgi:hypothetical protein
MRHLQLLSRSVLVLLFVPFLLVLSGCSGAFNATGGGSSTNGIALQGKAYGGETPIIGQKIYLYAATTTGYGNAATSLLTSSVPAVCGSGSSPCVDGSGNYYAVTGANGSFSITGDWSCTAGTYIYLLGVGGNTGGGSNPNAYLMAALGNCSSITGSTYITMNEVTTVASVYALSGFMSSPTQVSSASSAASQAGLAAAFATTGNLVTISTGAANTTTPGSGTVTGTVSTSNLNTLADVLAACVGTTGGVNNDGSTCGSLFYFSTPSGGTAATNTVQAALNIAHNPAVDPGGDLYGLITGTPPFNPYLSSTPYDWTMPIVFTGGGMSNLYDIAIDGSNNVWAISDGKETTPPCTSSTGSAVVELTNLGVAKSGSNGYTNTTYLICPFGITLDTSGNAWVTQDYAAKSYLVKITSAGAVSGLTPTTGDGDYFNNAAFDSGGNLWLSNYLSNYVSRYSSAGAWSKYTGGGIITESGDVGEAWGVAADGLGHVFFAVSSATGALAEFDATTGTTGTAVSTSAGYTGGGMAYPLRLAVDQGHNVWVANFGASASSSPGTTISELNSSGGVVTGSPFSGGGVDAPFGIAVDGGNNIWVADAAAYGVSEFSNAGNAISPGYGFIGTVESPTTAAMVFPEALAIDEAGNVWVANYGYTGSPAVAASITELVGAATPTLTPIEAATILGTPAAKP